MRICYTSDFHGRSTLYDQLTGLLHQEEPDVVILGGDMLPDGEDQDPDGTQAAWVDVQLRPRVEAWKQSLPALSVAFLMGNHDWLRSERAVRAQQDAGLLVLLESQRIWSHQGVSFIGCPLSPPTPHWVKDYERLDEDADAVTDFSGSAWATGPDGIAEVQVEQHFRSRPSMAAELAAATIPPEPWIFVAHTPPIDTGLDRLPNVESPIGSKAVRRFIESHQPLCALHGHVHESPEVTGVWCQEVAGVLCMNPGQKPDRLHAVCFDSDRLRRSLWHTVRE